MLEQNDEQREGGTSEPTVHTWTESLNHLIQPALEAKRCRY